MTAVVGGYTLGYISLMLQGYEIELSWLIIENGNVNFGLPRETVLHGGLI